VTTDSVIVTINGNQQLTYTAIKQVFPMGVLFHFPETALDTVKTVTTPPENQIVGSVKATELVEAKSLVPLKPPNSSRANQQLRESLLQ
jgi:hypothetical protein